VPTLSPAAAVAAAHCILGTVHWALACGGQGPTVKGRLAGPLLQRSSARSVPVSALRQMLVACPSWVGVPVGDVATRCGVALRLLVQWPGHAKHEAKRVHVQRSFLEKF
jgi:hypothetical protein